MEEKTNYKEEIETIFKHEINSRNAGDYEGYGLFNFTITLNEELVKHYGCMATLQYFPFEKNGELYLVTYDKDEQNHCNTENGMYKFSCLSEQEQMCIYESVKSKYA